MLGYALWVAIEDTLRNWLTKRLIDVFGTKWDEQFPTGIWNRLQERYGQPVKSSDFSHIRALLEHSDFPDLFDVVKYRKKVKDFNSSLELNDIDYYTEKLYTLRNQIAHKPSSFNIRNLDDLISCAEWVIEITGSEAVDLMEVRKGIDTQPEIYGQEIPTDFVQRVSPIVKHRVNNNLPEMDYEIDGGFVGRREEKKELKRRILNQKNNPIITISGAGGVGKTALAHSICEDILANDPEAFDGLVWISAKKDRLTVTGIEEIEPTARSFEEVLDAILSTFGFDEYIEKPVEEKRRIIQEIIFDDQNFKVLLVIDNLETVLHDEELIEYLKEVELPHKVLITSRLGLGEIERRFPLKEMSINDAVELFRRIAIEKSVRGLASLPNETISNYVRRMNSYPLVIKWVVGQAALNKDIERLVQNINSTDSDIAKFCFEYIYDHLLSNESKLILQVLAASEQDLTQPVLMHVAELGIQAFEDAMLQLELASLIIPAQQKDPQNETRILTKYGILPLTKAYINSKGGSNRQIKAKLQNVQSLVEDARRAKRLYELSFEYWDAETDGELIATVHLQTALNRNGNGFGDYSGAIEAIERAREIAPNFAAVYRSWGIIEAANKNTDTAIDLFDKATQLKPSDPITWFRWGNLEKDLGNYNNARRCLRKALELVKNKAPVLVALGNVEKQDSNFTLALNLLEEAEGLLLGDEATVTDRELIIAYTSKSDTYYRWAENYERDNQLEIAVEKVTRGYEIMVKVLDFGSADSKTRETYIKCMFLLGKLHSKRGSLDKAKQYLNEIMTVEMNPRIWTWEQRRTVVRACYMLIPILLDEGNNERAKAIYQHGLYCMASGDYFRDKYEQLGGVLEKANRFQGSFVNIIAEKGYGFIECKEISEGHIFAHVTDVIDEIGDDFSALRNVWVSFSVQSNEKGLAAKAIRILH